MRVILDTHAFLWFIRGDEKLSRSAIRFFEDRSITRYLSVVSIWEMVIKLQRANLAMPKPWVPFIANQMIQNSFYLMRIELNHLAELSSLAFHHRDPFDRLLIAQCISEEMVILSGDQKFDAYPVTRVW